MNEIRAHKQVNPIDQDYPYAVEFRMVDGPWQWLRGMNGQVRFYLTEDIAMKAAAVRIHYCLEDARLVNSHLEASKREHAQRMLEHLSKATK